MAKWYGKVGYAETVETDPGIWEESFTVREYYGDMYKNTRRLQNSSDGVNPNLTISNQISIVSDPYALQNFHAIRYAEYMGTKWTVESVEVEYPRLILSLGGRYNE